MYFQYDEVATEYLKCKDKRLGAVIDTLGHIDRAIDTDLFAAVVHHIIGQQISTKAQQTLWARIFERYRRRLSPYGSTASLYFWAVAGGAIPGMKDFAPRKKAAPKKRAATMEEP